ncbi:MAG: hypothetical protein AAF690_04880 [Acidobacteriota bacterium]
MAVSVDVDRLVEPVVPFAGVDDAASPFLRLEENCVGRIVLMAKSGQDLFEAIAVEIDRDQVRAVVV